MHRLLLVRVMSTSFIHAKVLFFMLFALSVTDQLTHEIFETVLAIITIDNDERLPDSNY